MKNTNLGASRHPSNWKNQDQIYVNLPGLKQIAAINRTTKAISR